MTIDMARNLIDLSISEAEFREMAIDAAKKLGWRCYFTWASIHSPKGFPDLVLCKPPRLIFAELKSQKGRITPAQQGWLDDLRACPHAEVHLWQPSRWPEIIKVLLGETNAD